MRRLRIPLIILGICIALAWGGARVMSRDLPQRLSAWMTQALGRPVTMTDATIRLLPLSIQVSELRVAGPTPQETPVIAVADLRALVHLPALLSGRIVVREVLLNTPHIFVHRTAPGGSNLPPRILPSHPSALSPPVHAGVLQLPDITWQVDQLIVTNGQVDLHDDAGNRTVRAQDIQLHASPIAPEAPATMDLTCSWQAGEAHGTLTIKGTVYPKPLRLAAPALTASITAPQGEISSLHGQLDVTMQPVSTSAHPPWPWLPGLHGTSTLAAENIRWENVQAPHAAAEISVVQGRIQISRLTAVLAQGTIHLEGDIDAATPNLATHLRLAARDMDLAQLFAMLGAPGRMRGTAAGDATLKAQGETLDTIKKTLAGEISLRLADGAALGVPLGAALRTAAPLLVPPTLPDQLDVAFTELTAQGPVHRGVLTADISGHGPWFTMAGAGQVHLPQNRLDADLRVSATAQAGRDLGPLAAVAQTTPIPLQVRGPISSPEVRVDLQRLLLRQAPPKAIERILQKPEEMLRGFLP